jgi:hypothetical protein
MANFVKDNADVIGAMVPSGPQPIEPEQCPTNLEEKSPSNASTEEDQLTTQELLDAAEATDLSDELHQEVAFYVQQLWDRRGQTVRITKYGDLQGQPSIEGIVKTVITTNGNDIVVLSPARVNNQLLMVFQLRVEDLQYLEDVATNASDFIDSTDTPSTPSTSTAPSSAWPSPPKRTFHSQPASMAFVDRQPAERRPSLPPRPQTPGDELRTPRSRSASRPSSRLNNEQSPCLDRQQQQTEDSTAVKPTFAECAKRAKKQKIREVKDEQSGWVTLERPQRQRSSPTGGSRTPTTSDSTSASMLDIASWPPM